jgi:hypothetical protein
MFYIIRSGDRMLRLPSEGLVRFALTFGRLQVSYYFANATVSIVKGEVTSQNGGQNPPLSIILPATISFPAASTPTRTTVINSLTQHHEMVCDALVSADRMLRLPSEGLIRFVLTFGR